VIRGELGLADAEREIVAETMRFAKRQLTWFRHQQPDARWFADLEAARRGIEEWLS
jgi:tRNA dimethylallyltransferase